MARIVAEGLGKRFRRYAADRPRTLKEAMIRGWRGQRAHGEFWALQDVAFQVESGSTLALIGHNGSGKSTLLRMIGGVLRPDAGRLETDGHILGLLELNSGMHQDLSGRENAIIGGVVAGLSRHEVRQRLDEIVAFAELENFIDNPLRTYSAGMRLRLGFSVAVHGRPDILLIDEVLAVGDLAFQAKCLEKVNQFREEGCAIVLATHDLSYLDMADAAIWLKNGRAVAQGEPSQVAHRYRSEAEGNAWSTSPYAPDLRTSDGAVLRSNVNRFGSYAVEIIDVRLRDAEGLKAGSLKRGEPLIIEVDYQSRQPAPALTLSVTVSNFDFDKFLNIHSDGDQTRIPAGTGRASVQLTLDRLDLMPGSYFVDVGLYDEHWENMFDLHWHAHQIEVAGSEGDGVLDPPRSWKAL